MSFLFLLVYTCSCLTVFLSVFEVFDAGVGPRWWRCFYHSIHAQNLTREMLTYNTRANIVYSSQLVGSLPNSSNAMVHYPQAASTCIKHLPLASPDQTLTNITPSGYHITTCESRQLHIHAHAHHLASTSTRTGKERSSLIFSHI